MMHINKMIRVKYAIEVFFSSITDIADFISVWFPSLDLTATVDNDDFIERAQVLQTGARLLLYKPGKWIPRSMQRIQKFSPHLQQLY